MKSEARSAERARYHYRQFKGEGKRENFIDGARFEMVVTFKFDGFLYSLCLEKVVGQ